MKLGVRADCRDLTITVENVTWMSEAAAPQWGRTEGHVIEFDGAPSLRCNFVLGIAGEDHTDMGCLTTAMHAVHAIRVIRSALAGVLDLADMSLVTEGLHG